MSRANFYPRNAALPLVFAFFFIMWFSMRLRSADLSGPFWYYLPILLLGGLIYYFFFASRIAIINDKLFVPRMSAKGFPTVFPAKQAIDIRAIQKIIKHRSGYGRPFFNYRIAALGNQISLIAKSGSIQLSYNFYGEDVLEGLVAQLLEINEDIEVIE